MNARSMRLLRRDPFLFPPTLPTDFMSILQPGADAPDFELESHKNEKIKGSSYKGQKKVMLVFYPLDFTPT